jgi:O-acetyl-ADP-ribose deacetylase (regulator of RNase III)
MITTQKFDLLTAPVDAIIHQCNCFRAMGGLAGAIARMYPEAADADLQTKEGAMDKLGTVSVGYAPDRIIINMYGQYHPGPDTRIDAVNKGLMAARVMIAAINGENPGKPRVDKVGIPYMMGCGIGGGNWEAISKVIEEVFQDAPFDVVICKRD